MKKLVLFAVILFAGTWLSTDVNAQAKKRIGFFLAAESGDFDLIGFGGVGEFRVANQVTIAPQLIFYVPEEHGNVEVGLLEININCNYYFYDKDAFEFYGLAGLNFARSKVDFDGPGNDHTDTEMGLNLGAGLNLEIGKNFIPFTELRFTLGEYDQFVFNAGLKFNLH